MDKLVFVSSWNNFEHAWSGTPNGLYSALSKKLALEKLDAAPKQSKVRDILDLFTMQALRFRSIKKRIKEAAVVDGMPLFVFGEYSTPHIQNTYCYQDLSIDYLCRLRQQDSTVAQYAISNRIPSFMLQRKRKIANQFYRDAAGIFTMAEWLKKDIIENTGISESKVHHVGGGCSIDVSKIDYSRKQGNRFLFVGKDWSRKNGDLVVRAFEQLQAMYPDENPMLYIAGPTQCPPSVEGKKNIVFLGRRSHEELVEYYNLCDYFVMPSKFEAYGLVFAEALSFGLPCIGKNICAMPEFIQEGENGFLIQDDNAEELACAMGKMLLEGKSIADFVQEKREYYIEKYSWDSVAERIICVLKNDGYLQ